MKRYAPDRYAVFQSYYQPLPKRSEVTSHNYTIQDWFRQRGYDVDGDHLAWISVGHYFINQLTILRSVRDGLEWQTLSMEDHETRGLQLAILETARAARALAGTVLESYLKRLATKHQVKLRK